MLQDLADDRRLQVAEPAGGRGLDLVDGGQEPRAEFGVLRFDPAGDPMRVAYGSIGQEPPGRSGRDGEDEQDRQEAEGVKPHGALETALHAPPERGERQPEDRPPSEKPEDAESARYLFQRLPQLIAHVDRASAWARRGRLIRPASQVSAIRTPMAATISHRHSF